MCGRYSLFVEEDPEIEAIFEAAHNQPGGEALKTGEIFPTDTAPVLISVYGNLVPRPQKWGLPGYNGKGVIINARAETAAEKPSFREALRLHRCAIPSTGFYEWDANKQKHRFTMRQSGALYMAGLYNEIRGEPRFVILTTEANASVAGVHARMPVVLPRDLIDGWVQDTGLAMELLGRVPPRVINR